MIEILNYERVSKNKVIGYADIKIPPMQTPSMIIRRIAHLQSGDRAWFNLPNFSRDKLTGEKEYLPFWQFELGPHNGQLLESLTKLVEKYCLDHKIAQIESLSFGGASFDTNAELPF